MTEFKTRSIAPADKRLDLLATSARDEGYRFVDRLIGDWESGANRFSKGGEKLLGVVFEDTLVAVGGLNRDPYTHEDHVGRLRHVYVLRNYRRRGVGRLLVAALLNGADMHFRKIRLRSQTEAAHRFYNACGFQRSNDSDASHERMTGDPSAPRV